MTSPDGAEIAAELVQNGDGGAEGEDAVNGGESPTSARAAGTKTPPAAEQHQTPPLSANTRASTRKRRSAAPIFVNDKQNTTVLPAADAAASDVSADEQQKAQSPSPAKQRKAAVATDAKKDSNSNQRDNGGTPRINLDTTDEEESSGNSKEERKERKKGIIINQNNSSKRNNSNIDEKNNTTSADDPFNFTTQSDVHPEPLKNISIERSSFNEVKYTKSLPSSADRYANMEKIAASRNPQLAASLSAQPTYSQDSLSHLSSMTSTSLRLELSCTSESGSTPKSITGQRATITALTASGSTRKKRGEASSTATTPRSKRKGSARVSAAAAAAAAAEEEEEENEEEGMDDDSFRMEVDDEQDTKQGGSAIRKRGLSKTASSTPKTLVDAGVPKTPERGSARRAGIDSARKAAEEQQKRKEADLYTVPELTPDEQLAIDCPKESHVFMGVGARVLALWGTDYYAANICGREALGRYYVHFVEDNLNRTLPPTGVVPLSALKPGIQVSYIAVEDDNDEVGKVSVVVEQPATDNASDWTRGEFTLRELDEEKTPDDVIKTVSWAKLFLNKDQGHKLLQQQQQQKTPVGRRTTQKLNPVQDIDEENIISDARSFRRSRSAALARLSTNSSSSLAAAAAAAAAATAAAEGSSEDNNTSLENTPTPPRTPRKTKQPTTPGKRKPSPAVDTSSGGSTTRSSVRRKGSRSSPRLAPVAEDEQQQKQAKEEKDEEEDQKKDMDKTEKEQVTEQQQQEEKMEEDSNGEQQDVQTPQQQLVTGKRKGTSETIAQQQQQQQHEKDKSEASPTLPEQAATTTKQSSDEEEPAIFAGLKFVLTSATRPNKKVTDFNKRDYRKKIEERGGQIVEDFTQPLAPDETAYLIADTYYRTHKYLSALSLSIPCVSYKWIQQCVSEKKLTDHQAHLLPAGESSLDPNQQFEWKPLKGVLMAGKRVLICSNSPESDPSIVSFAEIWTTILQNLGATLVGIGDGEPFAPKSTVGLEQKLAFCGKVEPPVDVLLAETDCPTDLAKLVEERAGLAVSSEWVIQAIVTGSLPELSEPGGERFRYDSAV